MKPKHRILHLAAVAALTAMLLPMTALAEEIEPSAPAMYATFWALVPPVVAIALALITKEVYSSLFIGILVGGLFFSGFSFEGTVTHVFQEGFLSVLSDSYNVGILIFLVILGIIVSLMNKAGGSAAFGRWASEKIKSRAGAQFSRSCSSQSCVFFHDRPPVEGYHRPVCFRRKSPVISLI